MNNFRNIQTRAALHSFFKINFIFLIFPVAFFGCVYEKDIEDFEFNSCTSECVYFDGRIIDASNNERLDEAGIKVGYKSFAGFGYFVSVENKYYNLGTVKSHDNGKYYLNFHLDFSLRGYYSMDVSKDGYFNQNYRLYKDDLQIDTIVDLITHLIPEGVLNINISQKFPKDSLDRLDIRLTCACSTYLDSFPRFEFEDVFRSSQSMRVLGNIDSTSSSFSFPSGELIHINYNTINNGIEREYSDSIILNNIDTTNYTIEY